MRPWRHVLNGAILLVILVVAGVVQATTPTDDERDAAIAVSGSIGDTLSGRNIAGRVDSVELAHEVSADNGWTGETTGTWVVVEARASAVVDETTGPSLNAVLRIGDTTYSASSRPRDATIADASLQAGIPVTGALVFEVPSDVLTTPAARAARIEFAAKSDTRADSLVVVTVDLTALDIRDSVSVVSPKEGR